MPYQNYPKKDHIDPRTAKNIFHQSCVAFVNVTMVEQIKTLKKSMNKVAREISEFDGIASVIHDASADLRLSSH